MKAVNVGDIDWAFLSGRTRRVRVIEVEGKFIKVKARLKKGSTRWTTPSEFRPWVPKKGSRK